VGGVKLPLTLAEQGLIDEYELVVQPRLAGLSKHVDLKLVSRVEFGHLAFRIARHKWLETQLQIQRYRHQRIGLRTKRRSGIHQRCRVAELSGLQRPGDRVRTEDDAGRHCVRADQLE
jgi:hypothetical protein